MIPGEIVYFICDDAVEKVWFRGRDQLGCVIDFYGDAQRVREESLTTNINIVIQHIEKRISQHEARLVTLKAKLQEFESLRVTNETTNI